MRFLALIIVLWSFGSAEATAQDPATLVQQHRYTEAIDMAGDDLDALDGATLTAVAVAHLRRGRLLRDLAALQTALAVDYYEARLADPAATPTPWTRYYLGRHLVAHGRPDAARAALDAAANDARLPRDYRRRAQIWHAASRAQTGARVRWPEASADAALAGEYAYARFLAGTPEAPACGDTRDATPAALRCRLWAAVRTADADALPPLQRRLLAADLTDQEVGQGRLTLRFYDPATLDMLAAADFQRALEAFRRLGTAEGLLFAGVSAFEAGHDVQARVWLGQSEHPLRHAYLAALAVRQRDDGAANTHSAEARRAGADVAVEWAYVMSRYPAQHGAVRQAARALRADAGSQRRARLLGRALLQAGRPADALAILAAAYPTLHHHDLARIEPGFLATLAHAEWHAGRAFYPSVRSRLATLAEAFPVAAGVLYLAQAHTAPQRLTSFNKRTGE